MKMFGARINPLGEAGLGEPEQDANSALTELDKGRFYSDFPIQGP